ncbi:MAG: acetyl-CoA carboxylase biotin carboxyl carrier protein [Acidobacteria bacterium]|nr:MAG: acetyl-CoA carboxylase biotin carboxyl carrier protein [Acidobacteriota bacterium]
MEFDEINRILDLVREHELSEFELEREGFKIRIRKNTVAHAPAPSVAPAEQLAAPAPVLTAPMAAAPAPLEAVPSLQPASDELDFAIVKSPIVGTFFRASEPGAAPFVDVGTSVRKGQVLCIIEAMKLMNEIDSEYEGEIVKIYVENGQPVQYGERLFAIKV